MKVQDKEFREALKRYQKLSGKTFADIVNTKIYYILLESRKRTPKASHAEIDKVYGPGFRLRTKNRVGKDPILVISPRRYAKEVSTRKRGNPFRIWHSFNDGTGVSRDVIAQKVRKMVGDKHRSVSYTVAGFNDALRRFQRAAGIKGPRIARGPKRKEQRGGGMPARSSGTASQRLSAFAIYSLRASFRGRGQVPRRVEQIVREETDREKRGTIDHVTQKQMRDLQRKARI